MLDITLKKNGTEGELILVGRMDAVSSPGAEQLMLQTAERFDTLILNMEKLEYISSAGLRALKKARLAMKNKGGTLAAKNVTKPIMEIFEMTSFAPLLKFI